MTFEELLNIISDYQSDPVNSNVIFGCECGCGGDSYDDESWSDDCQRADEAKAKLEEIGITFDE